MDNAVTRGNTYGSITDVTAVRSFTDIQWILRSTEFAPLKGDEPPEAKPFVEGTLAALSGDEHLHRRRLLAPLFSNEMLAYFYDHSSRPVVVETLTALADAHRGSPGPPRADLAPMGAALLLRTAAQVVGIDDVAEPTREAAFSRIVARWSRGLAVEFHTDPEGRIPVEGAEARLELDADFFTPSMERRRGLVDAFRAGRIKKSDLPRDAITFWLLDETGRISREKMFTEVGALLIASTRTQQRTLPHVVQHISEWVAEHPEDADQVLNGPFLRGAISETLRIRELFPAMTRRAITDVTLPSGATLSAGEKIALHFGDANRDPDWYGADADSFNPYRIDSLERKVPPWGLTFGGGIHMCLGRRLVTGGDWRRESSADDVDVDGGLVAIIRTLFEAGVEADPDRSTTRDHDYDEYLFYPVRFASIEQVVGAAVTGVTQSMTGSHSAPVTVDRKVCEGSGLCARTLPSVFALGSDGMATVDLATAARTPADELREVAVLCPTMAIAVRADTES